MARLTEQQAAFLRRPLIATAITLRKDGSPHATPVWIDTDGERVIFNTTLERKKGRNIENDPRVAVIVLDPEDAYRWLSVSGVAELDLSGADAHIDALSEKYLGHAYAGHTREMHRVIVRVTPEQIDSRGLD